MKKASWEHRGKKHVSILEDVKKGISLEVIFGLSVKGLAKLHKVEIKASARLPSHLESGSSFEVT